MKPRKGLFLLMTPHHGKIARHQVLEKFCRQARKAIFLLREYTLMVFDQSKK